MKPKQFYFVLIALGIILLLATVGLFVLMHQKLDSDITTISRLNADLELESERLSQLQKLEKDYQRLAPLIDKVSNILPAQKQQAEIIAQIDALSVQTGLRLTNLSFQPTKGLPGPTTQTETAPIGGIKTMPISFKINGTYGQLQSLLRKFERQERYMQVNSLAIAAGKDDELTIDMKLVVFVKP